LIGPQTKKADGELETPDFTTTQHFFLDLPSLKDELAAWLKTRKDWRPNVIRYALGLLDEVQPRAMSRDIDWGIPIPLPGWEDQPNKRLYVWFDAVIGYLSASIEWARRFGTDPEQYQEWWKDSQIPSYYFMGKDNIAFHAEIWPAQLLGYAGRGSKGGTVQKLGQLNLPTEIVSSEFLTMNGGKFSTSQNVVIYVKDFLAQYQPDTLRYFIEIAGPESQDANFTWEDFYQRVNSELVGNWGNLVNRTLSIIHKKFGRIPDLSRSDLKESDNELLENIEVGFDSVGALLDDSKFRAAFAKVMLLSDSVNQY
jgi:methionyl-tRNA synthetase